MRASQRRIAISYGGRWGPGKVHGVVLDHFACNQNRYAGGESFVIARTALTDQGAPLCARCFPDQSTKENPMEMRPPKERDMFSFKQGHLVVFRDVGPLGETKTQYDDHSPCVTAKNIYDITAGKQFADALVFGKAVIHAIFSEECVVGVVAKGPASAGKSGAWLLDAPTEAQLQEARDYVDAMEGSWGGS